LKIDVEGGEVKVVEGGIELIQSGMVQNIIMEGRRFGRVGLNAILMEIFQAGYFLKEPIVPGMEEVYHHHNDDR
jgi:hypothetical protein